MTHQNLLERIREGDFRALSRAISLVENELDGADQLLLNLDLTRKVPVFGVTGPPGAGKSTLVNALIRKVTSLNKSIGVIAIDPTSPFNYGSLLGDRIRMAEHFNNEKVFIRSLATRGSLGGLSAKTIEIVDLFRAFTFDFILIETVGVGQSEVEIAGLADTTIVTLVPEAGDEIQAIKSGLMEIADVFVVNKADHVGADEFANNLKKLLHQKPKTDWDVPVIKTIADKNEGIEDLFFRVLQHQPFVLHSKKPFLLTEKAFKLIQYHKMKEVDKTKLLAEISVLIHDPQFNLYQFIRRFIDYK